MDSTFGARLRQQREERQVTLHTISTQTKIKISVLEALESDDVSTWPKGLFGRAYLRDYAAAVGLDAESVVSEFLALHPEFAYIAPQVEEAEAEEARRSAAQKFRRFVSSAFSGRTPRIAINAPGTMAERLHFEHHPEAGPDAPHGEPDAIGDLGPVLAGPSMAHVFAEAEDRTPAPFAELDAQEAEDAIVEPVAPPHVHAPAAASREISVSAIADVCTRLARALDWREVTTLLADSARLLDAVGVIVWQWDPRATALRPSLACGYPDSVVARLPEVRSDDANAVATAFRSGEQCVVDGAAGTVAVVVPSFSIAGCVGVLAVELRPGTRERESVCAFTNILAAQLATLLPSPEPVEA
jgi:hypothetical protein